MFVPPCHLRPMCVCVHVCVTCAWSRFAVVVRFVVMILFFKFRVTNPNNSAFLLWLASVVCEIWFGISWIFDQLPKWSPITRETFLNRLSLRYEQEGRPCELPQVDVFVSTADPFKEPPLVTANVILSVLAADYPVDNGAESHAALMDICLMMCVGADVRVSADHCSPSPPTSATLLPILYPRSPAPRVACYLSDDGASMLTFEALMETANFSRLWVPFCRKHAIEPRAPEMYFSGGVDYLLGKVNADFVKERRRMKVRRGGKGRGRWVEGGAWGRGVVRFWGNEGGTAGVVRGEWVWMVECVGTPAGKNWDLKDPFSCNPPLPSASSPQREYDEFKVRMNALVVKAQDSPRDGWTMPDGTAWPGNDRSDHVGMIQAICFLADPLKGGRVCFVQFPQRFDGVDKSDRYANHNTVFYDVNMKGLDGQQGPMYVGTGCVFRRQVRHTTAETLQARWAFETSQRAAGPHVWGGARDVSSAASPPFHITSDPALSASIQASHISPSNLFFSSSPFLPSPLPFSSPPQALYGFDPPPKTPTKRRTCCSLCPSWLSGRPSPVRLPSHLAAGTPAAAGGAPQGGGLGEDGAGPFTYGGRATEDPHEVLSDVILVISCGYEDNTEWGTSCGWVYGSVTEDIVTGYKMHTRGWRSVYCMPPRPAFKGSAPINMTDRLAQVLRWATGSVEIFFSQHNPVWADCCSHLKPIQRIAYMNTALYPFTSIALTVYCFLPAISLFTGQFIVPNIDNWAVLYFLALFLSIFATALLEIRWSGVSLEEWWRNEQFWVIGGTSAHFAAVMQGLLKVVAGVEVHFTLTSKASQDMEDELAELYTVRWTWLFLIPLTIIIVNAFAILAGVAHAINNWQSTDSTISGYGHPIKAPTSNADQIGQLVGQVFFSVWVLLHLYPFTK
ncbi:unnamed protein product, partial [Closterium sp. Yama58-4]